METNDSVKVVETRPSEVKGGLATRVVAVVITALVFGALVYISRFAPRIFGMQLIYPAVAVAPAFGIWFQGWGGIGVILGTIISQLPAGLNPMVWVPANLAQALFAIIPALFFKADTITSWRRWLQYAMICTVTAVVGLLIVLWNVHLNGFVPFDVGLRTLFPIQLVGNVFWMVVVGPLVLNVVSPYIIKSGLKFRRFF